MSRVKSWLWVFVFVAFALRASAGTAADSGKLYGKQLTVTDTVKISEVLANPGNYVGKTVRVEGTVTGVCEKRGCWMSLASDKELEELRIKVEDGVMVFPISAKGKRAIAEGVLEKIDMTMEQTVAYAKHEAEERNKTFDPAAIKEPLVYYQVRAEGAVIF